MTGSPFKGRDTTTLTEDWTSLGLFINNCGGGVNFGNPGQRVKKRANTLSYRKKKKGKISLMALSLDSRGCENQGFLRNFLKLHHDETIKNNVGVRAFDTQTLNLNNREMAKKDPRDKVVWGILIYTGENGTQLVWVFTQQKEKVKSGDGKEVHVQKNIALQKIRGGQKTTTRREGLPYFNHLGVKRRWLTATEVSCGRTANVLEGQRRNLIRCVKNATSGAANKREVPQL